MKVVACNKCFDTGKVKRPYSDCGGYIYDACPPSHAGIFDPCPDCRPTNTKKLYCKHCTKEVLGKAYVDYISSSNNMDEIVVLHEDCIRPYNLNKKNLTHKCPKCNGLGNKSTDVLNLWTKDDGSMELVWASQMYHKPGRYNSGKFETIKEKIKPCDLCDGEGYLSKEPIPVITEWRKAT